MIQKHRHSCGKQAKSQMKCRKQVFSVSVKRQTKRRGRGWGEPCHATLSAWRQFQACSTPMGNMYMRAPTLLWCKEFRERQAGQNRTELKGQTWHQEKTLEICTRTEWLSVVRRENPTWRSKNNIREKAIMSCKMTPAGPAKPGTGQVTSGQTEESSMYDTQDRKCILQRVKPSN